LLIILYYYYYTLFLLIPIAFLDGWDWSNIYAISYYLLPRNCQCRWNDTSVLNEGYCITKENSRMTNRCHSLDLQDKNMLLIHNMHKIIQWKIIRFEGLKMQDLRPEIPRDTHPKLVELIHRCWHKDPCLRPDFSEILKFLQHINNMVWGGIELDWLVLVIVLLKILKHFLFLLIYR
jgi:hypothetical protein